MTRPIGGKGPQKGVCARGQRLKMGEFGNLRDGGRPLRGANLTCCEKMKNVGAKKRSRKETLRKQFSEHSGKASDDGGRRDGK